MNLRAMPLMDKLGLMLGSEVPVRKQKYFLQLETSDAVGARYARSWSHIDETAQKDPSYLEENDFENHVRKTVRKTGNEELLKLIHQRVVFFVEREDNTIGEND